MENHRLSLICVAIAGLMSMPVLAANKEQIMASKYMRYGFCMEKTYGQPWTTNSKLETVMNRWGVHEPTGAGIAAASPEVRQKDKECRSLNGIENEPRPQ